MPDDTSKSRRTFLRGAALTLAIAPVAGVSFTGGRKALAEDRPKAEDSHAHDYVNDASDASDHELYEENQLCENCVFWDGEVENGWGGCNHPDFLDVLVNAEGWCDAYAPAG